MGHFGLQDFPFLPTASVVKVLRDLVQIHHSNLKFHSTLAPWCVTSNMDNLHPAPPSKQALCSVTFYKIIAFVTCPSFQINFCKFTWLSSLIHIILLQNALSPIPKSKQEPPHIIKYLVLFGTQNLPQSVLVSNCLFLFSIRPCTQKKGTD